MAQSFKCQVCCKPMVCAIHPEDSSCVFTFCKSPECNPMLVANLMTKDVGDEVLILNGED